MISNNEGLTLLEIKDGLDILKAQGNTDEDILEVMYMWCVEDQMPLETLEAICGLLGREFTSEFKVLSDEEKKTAGLDGIDHLFRKMGFQGENEIEEGTMFSECTKAQLEWAKTQDKMTEYYIKIWQNPEENAMQLCDPMWINGKWEDCIW